MYGSDLLQLSENDSWVKSWKRGAARNGGLSFLVQDLLSKHKVLVVGKKTLDDFKLKDFLFFETVNPEEIVLKSVVRNTRVLLNFETLKSDYYVLTTDLLDTKQELYLIEGDIYINHRNGSYGYRLNFSNNVDKSSSDYRRNLVLSLFER